MSREANVNQEFMDYWDNAPVAVEDDAYVYDVRQAAVVPPVPEKLTRAQIDANLARYATGKPQTNETAYVVDVRGKKTVVRPEVSNTADVKRKLFTKKRVGVALGVSAVMAGAWLGPREIVCNQSENIPVLRTVMEFTGRVENDYRCEIPAPMFYQPDKGPMIIEEDN